MPLILATTTIGYLLLGDKITPDEDDDPISDFKLEIPFYQRPYKWTDKNVIQLLDDILNAKNANKQTYRVGTLILHQEVKKNQEGKHETTYDIVDGQQRTITFSLLLKVLLNALDDNSNIRFLQQELADNPHNRRNVPNNFRTLERRVNSLEDKKDKEDLLKYIRNNCQLIVVITDDLSEAFQFFDSQNARGKKLYPHDLLKAYHLREMNYMDADEKERTAEAWQALDQKALSALFKEYLYRVKEWTKGNKAGELTEHNIHIFKGITRQDNYPYAQFYKGAHAYSAMVNHFAMLFEAGPRNLNAFQLDAPIIAGQPFFDYTQHYFEILKDIRNNEPYESYYLKNNKNNDIVKTLNLRKYINGTGNLITRLLFDTAILLYVDRFCPERPTQTDSALLNQFVLFAFIWAYSLRAQHDRLGWPSAQKHIMGTGMINSFNIYRVITEADSPAALLGLLSAKVKPLPKKAIRKLPADLDERDDKDIYLHYLYYFVKREFMRTTDED